MGDGIKKMKIVLTNEIKYNFKNIGNNYREILINHKSLHIIMAVQVHYGNLQVGLS